MITFVVAAMVTLVVVSLIMVTLGGFASLLSGNVKQLVQKSFENGGSQTGSSIPSLISLESVLIFTSANSRSVGGISLSFSDIESDTILKLIQSLSQTREGGQTLLVSVNVDQSGDSSELRAGSGSSTNRLVRSIGQDRLESTNSSNIRETSTGGGIDGSVRSRRQRSVVQIVFNNILLVRRSGDISRETSTGMHPRALGAGSLNNLSSTNSNDVSRGSGELRIELVAT
mmetsp:Transcript_16123/g.18081  ORF Transcript_16123/g.18081 Transcript_16123/m.18081 type:complete len:229 (-) Transcript_16123:155-841(-)